MQKPCGEDNIASASIQTHDAMKTFKLKGVITYMKFGVFVAVEVILQYNFLHTVPTLCKLTVH